MNIKLVAGDKVRLPHDDDIGVYAGHVYQYSGEYYLYCYSPRLQGYAYYKEEGVTPVNDTPGYHLTEITKEPYGSINKIQEEVSELLDAHAQGSKVMILVELSDLYGAIEGYLENNHPGITMEDLSKFSAITKRAFLNGRR